MKATRSCRARISAITSAGIIGNRPPRKILSRGYFESSSTGRMVCSGCNCCQALSCHRQYTVHAKEWPMRLRDDPAPTIRDTQIGARLREARIERGVQQKVLAAQLGMDQSVLSRYERGELRLPALCS